MNFRILLSVVLCSAAPALLHADDATFDSNGVKIHYVTAGEGEPFVMIHGWMSDVTMWGKELKPPEGFKLIALDCRGHGKSDKPHDPNQYGKEMAEDVARLLDHLEIKKAHLIGYSMGAFIAAKIAAAHSERVLSVIYGGQSPLLIGEAGSKEIDVFAKAVEDGKGLGPYLMHVRPGLTLEQANAVAKSLYAGKDVKAWAVAGQSFKGLEVRADELKKCKAPCMFIYGSKENENTKNRVANLRKLLGNTEEKVIDGGDHVTTLVFPEFGKAILESLKANKAK